MTDKQKKERDEMVDNYPKFYEVFELLEELDGLSDESENHMVGGCIRDMFFGVQPTDFDIVTNLDLSVIDDNFSTIDFGKSRDHGITVIKWKDTMYDISSRIGKSLGEDSETRDFTMNSLYMDYTGEILDYNNGVNDIIKREINTCGNSIDRFIEDPIRMIRLIRFAVQHELQFNLSVHESLCECTGLLNDVSIERFTKELRSVAKLGGKSMAQFLDTLHGYNILEMFIPKLVECEGCINHWEDHPEGAVMMVENKWVKDAEPILQPLNLDLIEQQPDMYKVIQNGTVYDHIMECLCLLPDDSMSIVVLSTLFHDIGKPDTREVSEQSTDELLSHKFDNHESVGVDVFSDIADHLKLSSLEKKIITYCIRNHSTITMINELPLSEYIRMVLDPSLDILVSVTHVNRLVRCVPQTRFNDKKFLDILSICDDVIGEYCSNDTLNEVLGTLIDGNIVMELRPDLSKPTIGKVLNIIKDRIINKQFEVTEQEVKDWVSNWIEMKI